MSALIQPNSARTEAQISENGSSYSLEIIELAIQSPLPPSSSTVITIGEDQANNNALNFSSNAGQRHYLAPVDKGFRAWSFLAAAFFVEAIVWGFPNSYGVFLEAYLADRQYASQKRASSLLPLVGSLSSGLMYCSGLLLHPITEYYPHHRRTMLWLGTVACCVSLFGASYASKVRDLVLLQGVFYAIGGSLLYAPCISYMSEWFVQRRGLANGVIFAGTSVGGLVLPLILSPLVRSCGLAKTLRIVSLGIGGILFPLLPFVKPRLPESHIHGPGARTYDRSWMKNISFWLIMAANTVQGFAYFLPIIWLPTFATDINESSANSALTLSLLNAASVFGRLTLGMMSDKFNPWLLALSTLGLTSLATFVLWGILSHTFVGLLAFGMTYGILAGGWSSLWTGFVRPIANDDPRLSTSLFGYLMLSRGLGNILCTPISSILSNSNGATSFNWHEGRTGFEVGGGRFEKIILYVGTCFAGAAFITLAGWAHENYNSRTVPRN